MVDARCMERREPWKPSYESFVVLSACLWNGVGGRRRRGAGDAKQLIGDAVRAWKTLVITLPNAEQGVTQRPLRVLIGHDVGK